MGFEAFNIKTGHEVHIYSIVPKESGYVGIGYDWNIGAWFEISLNEIEPNKEEK